AEQVEQFCERYPNVKFNFCKQEKRLGLGHAIRLGLSKEDSPVLVILGDSIFKLDYHKFVESSFNRIGVQEVEDPKRFGIIEISENQIVKFLEKPDNPPTNLAISGLYYLTSQQELAESIDFLVENNITTNNEYQLTDALARMLDTGSVFTYYPIIDWLDCGLYETVLSTNKKLLKGASNVISPTARIEKSVLTNCSVGDNCVVQNSSLNNVILLDGSQVRNSDVCDKIVNYNEVISG
ncbi:MAG: sugar phosphate nucleotidyltransferase, partial [Fidelibacterota bacterium]